MPNLKTPVAPPSYSSDEELEALLLEGMDSGQPVEENAEFWAKLHADLAQRRFENRRAS